MQNGAKRGGSWVWACLSCALCACTNELWVAAPADGDAGVTEAGAEFADADSAAVDCAPGFVRVEGNCTFDVGELGERVRNYRDGHFVPVTREPFERSSSPFLRRWVFASDTMAEWIDGTPTTARDLYSIIDPDDRTSYLPGSFPAGTVLLNESVDEGLFDVMAKRGLPFDVATNGWWFARFYKDGTPVPTDLGPDTKSCMDCHADGGDGLRTDLLHGVPREALVPR